MATRAIKRSLRTRLQRLEAAFAFPDKGPPLRIGLLRQLPAGYTGERHVVMVAEGEAEVGRPAYTFEERPGPAPPGTRDPVPWLPLTEAQLQMIGDPIEE
jgi:hypothetical protein